VVQRTVPAVDRAHDPGGPLRQGPDVRKTGVHRRGLQPLAEHSGLVAVPRRGLQFGVEAQRGGLQHRRSSCGQGPSQHRAGPVALAAGQVETRERNRRAAVELGTGQQARGLAQPSLTDPQVGQSDRRF
jgi:hypothetical protein